MSLYWQLVKTTLVLLLLIFSWLLIQQWLTDQKQLSVQPIKPQDWQALTLKNKQLNKQLSQLETSITSNLNSATLALLKTAEQNHLHHLSVEQFEDKSFDGYQNNYIHYHLLGTYPNYWQFKKQLSDKAIIWQTVQEQLTRHQPGVLAIKGVLLVLSKSK